MKDMKHALIQRLIHLATALKIAETDASWLWNRLWNAATTGGTAHIVVSGEGRIGFDWLGHGTIRNPKDESVELYSFHLAYMGDGLDEIEYVYDYDAQEELPLWVDDIPFTEFRRRCELGYREYFFDPGGGRDQVISALEAEIEDVEYELHIMGG